MALERGLLDRLRNPEPESARTTRENPRLVTEAVLAHLRQLLNSRQGLAPACMDYGMPDLCDLVYTFPQAASDLRKAIKASLEKYEPRLRRVVVSQAENTEEPLTLRFEIRAELATEEGRTPIWIQTRIDEFGGIEVKG
jgi:type VI secretion system protein